MKQYDVWLADIPAPKGSHVQHGRRPVVIISNNLANTHSPVVTVIPLTSQMNKHQLPTHVYLWGQRLNRASIALCEQVMAVDKTRLLRRMGIVYKAYTILPIQFSIDQFYRRQMNAVDRAKERQRVARRMEQTSV